MKICILGFPNGTFFGGKFGNFRLIADGPPFLDQFPVGGWRVTAASVDGGGSVVLSKEFETRAQMNNALKEGFEVPNEGPDAERAQVLGRALVHGGYALEVI